MFNLKRNQVIITVLVFMIAIAAYLNTQETPNSFQPNDVADSQITEPEEVDFFEGYDEQVVADNQATDTQAAEVTDAAATAQTVPDPTQLSLKDANSTESISATITKKSEEKAESTDVAASKNLEDDYFAEEKLLREQSRAEQVEQLTQYVSNDNLDQDSKSKAAANLIEIQERIEKENSAEALLKAKGFINKK